MKVALVILFYASIIIFPQNKNYKHSDFPVNKEDVNFLSNPTSSEALRDLKTLILSNGDTVYQYIKFKPNFASHFEIIEWSCGSPCGQAIIIDLVTTTIFDTISYCYSLDFNPESYLIIADNLNYDMCGVKYYVLKGEQLIELK